MLFMSSSRMIYIPEQNLWLSSDNIIKYKNLIEL